MVLGPNPRTPTHLSSFVRPTSPLSAREEPENSCADASGPLTSLPLPLWLSSVDMHPMASGSARAGSVFLGSPLVAVPLNHAANSSL
jgi:hypothetical protein